MLNSEHYLCIFDLELILFRNIKEENDRKIDFNVKLEELQHLGLIKSYNYPFFLFRDNINRNKINFAKDYIIEDILAEDELYLAYKYYLTRVCPLLHLTHNSDLEAYFILSKKGINEFNKLSLNPLISHTEDLDWFIYDDESLSFFMDMEYLNYLPDENIKYGETLTDVVFQDKYAYQTLPKKHDVHKSYLIALSYNNEVIEISYIVYYKNRIYLGNKSN